MFLHYVTSDDKRNPTTKGLVGIWRPAQGRKVGLTSVDSRISIFGQMALERFQFQCSRIRLMISQYRDGGHEYRSKDLEVMHSPSRTVNLRLNYYSWNLSRSFLETSNSLLSTRDRIQADHKSIHTRRLHLACI
jgi:hypothetical protein